MKLIARGFRVKNPIVHVAKENRNGYWNPLCGKVYNQELTTFEGPHEWINCQDCIWFEGLRDRVNKRWTRPVPSNRPRRR